MRINCREIIMLFQKEGSFLLRRDNAGRQAFFLSKGGVVFGEAYIMQGHKHFFSFKGRGSIW